MIHTGFDNYLIRVRIASSMKTNMVYAPFDHVDAIYLIVV
jgi:hypothetical protein